MNVSVGYMGGLDLGAYRISVDGFSRTLGGYKGTFGWFWA